MKRGPEATGRTDAGVRIVRALRRYIDESELYVSAAGRDHEMHRTDLIGLAALLTNQRDQAPPMTPGRLSTALALSPAATTAMLTRLERAGHVVRSTNPDDARSVIVELTDLAHATGQDMFQPLAMRMTALLATRTDDELEHIAEFLDAASDATRGARAELRERR